MPQTSGLILNGSDQAGTAITADSTSLEIINPPAQGFCITYAFNVGSGNLAATLRLQVWNGANIGWVTDPQGLFPAHPAGASTINTVTFWDMRGRKYRILVDFTSGSGPGLIEMAMGNFG